MSARSVFRYEWQNILRSRWLYAYTLLLTGAVSGFGYLAADSRRTELALIAVLVLLVPLVSMLFTTAYWYSAERFTELLITQPVSRNMLFWSRMLSLIGSLTLCLLLALVIPGVLFGLTGSGVFWIFTAVATLGAIFCALGALVATYLTDRMWGIGLGLAIWFYFVAIHDALALLIIYWFREYPLDLSTSVICALNPLALARVSLLFYFDAPLLLGHAGALIQNLSSNKAGLCFVSAIFTLWLFLPLMLARRKFIRRDF